MLNGNIRECHLQDTTLNVTSWELMECSLFPKAILASLDIVPCSDYTHTLCPVFALSLHSQTVSNETLKDVKMGRERVERLQFWQI